MRFLRHTARPTRYNLKEGEGPTNETWAHAKSDIDTSYPHCMAASLTLLCHALASTPGHAGLDSLWTSESPKRSMNTLRQMSRLFGKITSSR